ncbi:hypothetical protein [Nostoc sp. CHAB 5715]|uniref:hypothetical protein n=1 Tax=Nostoc sp. CHAB 5715 TaxID=2780400 RepID=UPI001E4C9BE1|nr:hypothetical protein [Nostoc sp. CHAB 5715]MCC5619943.1 hypothetical protein [Nostoc sp. CHAB 5715]
MVRLCNAQWGITGRVRTGKKYTRTHVYACGSTNVTNNKLATLVWEYSEQLAFVAWHNCSKAVPIIGVLVNHLPNGAIKSPKITATIMPPTGIIRN